MGNFFIDSKNYNSRFKVTSVLRHKKAINCGVIHNSHYPPPENLGERRGVFERNVMERARLVDASFHPSSR